MNHPPPDDVFEGPGFTMKRYGRAIEMQAHRTPEEQARLLKSVWEKRPEMLAAIREASDELSNLIHKYTSFDMVANLMLRHVFYDADEYKETDSTIRPHFVEHATMLELKDPAFRLTGELFVTAPDLERAEALLDELFSLTTLYYRTEAADPARSGSPPTALDDFRVNTLLREMTVGPPAYTGHWMSVLEGLFGAEHIDAYLTEVLGFNIKAAISCAAAIGGFISQTLSERSRAANESQDDIKRELKRYMETGRFEGRPENKPLFDALRNMRSKGRKRAISSITSQWVTVAPSDILAFTSELIATRAEITDDSVKSFLKVFSLSFGSTPADYVIPRPVPAVRLRPIIELRDKHFCPLPSNILWAIKPTFEAALKKSSRWNSYQKHRSTVLVVEGLKALKKLMPLSQSYQSVTYAIGPEERAELDGLVLFDRYAILVEAKAGELGAARRGGKDSIREGLTELVGEASEQGTRARNYIRASQTPEFSTQTGEHIQLDKARCTDILVVALTLDSLDAFTPEANRLRDAGVVGNDDLPWSVCLTDLMAISDILQCSVEFTHFLRWRFAINETRNISAGLDELNWLAIYLKEGPELLRVPHGFDRLAFTSYTDKFDAYFHYREGYRSTPAERPAQHIPPPLRALLSAIETSGVPGFTAPAEFLLSLTFEERDNLSQQLQLMATRGDSSKPVTIDTPDFAMRLYPGQHSVEELRSTIGSHPADGRTTLLLSIDDSTKLQVSNWLILPKQA
jgi:hypothetical protein